MYNKFKISYNLNTCINFGKTRMKRCWILVHSCIINLKIPKLPTLMVKNIFEIFKNAEKFQPLHQLNSNSIPKATLNYVHQNLSTDNRKLVRVKSLMSFFKIKMPRKKIVRWLCFKFHIRILAQVFLQLREFEFSNLLPINQCP